jgi:RNA polymerase sigma factor (sigma-70 family)
VRLGCPTIRRQQAGRRTGRCREKSAIFDDLYRKYYQSIWVFAARLTGNRSDAADIAQETFVRLHQALNAGATIQLPRPWLYRVAANLSRNHVKRTKYFEQVVSKKLTTPQPDATAEEGLIRTEELMQLREAIDELSERDKLLVMCYQDHLSYAEIAEIAGIKAQSVGKLLSRAIDRLSEALVDECKR